MSVRFNWRTARRIVPADADTAREIALYMDDFGNVVIRKLHWAREAASDSLVYVGKERVAAVADALSAAANANLVPFRCAEMLATFGPTGLFVLQRTAGGQQESGPDAF